ILVNSITYLYILLFVYASVSKLLDFENFRIQLGQSPLIGAFADYLVWLVPIIEIFIAILLITNKFKIHGIYASYFLMVMFSAYIFIILHYSLYVPCSCGGVLEKLSWNAHLIFNILFVLLDIAGILIENKHLKKSVLHLFLLVFFGVSFILVLYGFSERIIQKANPFIRRFPPHIVEYETQTDLKYNSYYFAGVDNYSLYLGNTTAPLQVLKISKDLKEIQSIKITPEESSFHFRSLQLKVIPPYFYLADGTVPCIYGGKTTDWKAKLKLEGAPYFTLIESMDSINFVFRSNSLRSGENIIGILKLSHPPQFKLTDQLLQKQNKKDGIFDTDGTLLVDKESAKIIYLYRYRNQFIVADKNADLLYRGNTIDTISQARIQVSEVNGERTMSKPPLSVNTDAAVYKNLLFVN